MSGIKVDVIWSPVHDDEFITFGTDLRLFQVVEGDFKDSRQKIAISEKSVAAIQLVNTDYQYMKCVAWYPKKETPHLLAIGQANGKVVLTSLGPSTDSQDLVGREFVPRHARQCNCVAWNPVEHNLLVSGLDKNRSDCGILVWDVTCPPVQPFSNDVTPTHDRRQSSSSNISFLDSSSHSAGTYKAQTELGLAETANSLQWFLHQPKTLVCGMNNKYLKIFDLRDCSKHQNMTATKSVLGVCVDPYYEHRLASFVENQVMIWDIRNFEKPVVTLNDTKPVMKLSWSPKRCNLLASVTKDSSSLRLYDIQQAPLNSDDIEPTVVERSIQPQGPQVVSSFCWHPAHENRLLTISNNSSICDYTVFDRITVNWAPTSELIWTHGKKLLQYIDNSNKLFECLEDISVKMRIRAQMKYGLFAQQLWQNGEIAADDPKIQRMWLWLDYVKNLREEGRLRNSSRGAVAASSPSEIKYEGIRHVICHETSSLINPTTSSRSEEVIVPWQGLERLGAPCLVIYKSEDRDRALQLCQWESDVEGKSLNSLLERLEADGEYCRAAAIAIFNMKLKRAIHILSKGAHVRSAQVSPGIMGPPLGDTNLSIVAMALSGYSNEPQTLWKEMCATLKPQLQHAYLRAMFGFLTSSHHGNYDDVLNEPGITVQDKVAFACTFLPDLKLADFIEKQTARMMEIGDLDGILLTGLTSDGLNLLENYVDHTADVQTASFVISHSLNPSLCQNQKTQIWVESYRQLLDSWRLWQQRGFFDVQWYRSNASLWPPQQIFVSCNYCGKSISSHLQMMGQAHGPRSYPRISMTAANKGKVTSCPGCRKPLPRCALCLTNLGSPSGTYWKQRMPEKDSANLISLVIGTVEQQQQQRKLSKFSSWFTWCQTCRHGGHAVHMIEWFKDHSECPVTGCSCKCQSLDSVTAVTNS